MAASEVAALCEMPLSEKFKGLRCRTGNYMLFHFFHLRHRLPGSAARIISKNLASCLLTSSFKVTLFLVFNILTTFPLQLAWVKMGCGTPILGQNTKTRIKVNRVKSVFSKN
jgi:hypothetical protein